MKSTIFILVLNLFTFKQVAALSENKAVPLKAIEAIEKEVIEEVKKRNPSKKELVAIYNLAGRELFYLGYLKKAEEYYQKSIDVDYDTNKTESFINLMSIALTEKNLEKLKKQKNQAEAYYKNYKKYKTVEVETYLSSIDDVLNNKVTEGKVSFFAPLIRKNRYENVLKEKKYEEELLKYNVDNFADADMSTIVDYDFLNVLYRKKNVKKLFCLDQYKKYPDAFTPAYIICGMLNEYLQGREIKEDRFKYLEKYLNEINGERKYVVPYLRELK